MNFYDVINMLYNKKKVDVDTDTQLNITLSKWLSYDKNNLNALKRILKYQFKISSKHYFYLLYFNIPKKYKAPFLKKIKKRDEKEDKLLNKVAYILNWSKSDIKKNQNILNETILKNKKFWKKELAVE